MARRKQVITYEYQCQITGETFKTTKESKNPDELISVEGYYQLNPEEDDRPENIKKELALKSEGEQ